MSAPPRAEPARAPRSSGDRHQPISAVREAPPLAGRPHVRGKFLFAGEQKLIVRGVTYGTFRPNEGGDEYPEPGAVERDMTLMAAHGLNALRTYTVPPRSLLDAAERHGLRVMVGLPVERYIGYLADRRKDAPDIAALVAEGVGRCTGHPAVLAYSLGNEIPASVARWHGGRRVERYLERLCRTVRETDPHALVTYANYPSTEYLHLPFLDFLCFNVFLESPDKLDAYLGRLQTLAGDRPLVMGELGLDSLRHGEHRQAEVLDWQVRTAFAAGCAGTFVYSWTDEWHRGGEDVEDWGFGLTRRNREPKPSLRAVRSAYTAVPFGREGVWPRISVVVCTYNGARTLRECLAGLSRLDYPDCEVIVVNDGSTDESAAIAAEFPFRLITTENGGLSRARNVGIEAASGSIVAFIDDDAYPDPHWLYHLATTFRRGGYAGVGGPNLQPPGDGWIAECVASAPGNPVHILLSDREAEHVPGCNMAFRKEVLESLGGFDPEFRTAGDDVDLCWRLTDAGYTLGFSATALVWHHRRNSVRAFWRQQSGYGRAEGMLQRKWPERHDVDGHVSWAGRIYGRGIVRALTWGRGRVYHGLWGTAPFQSLYEPATGVWGAFTHSPLIFLVIGALAVLSLLGLDWPPLRYAALPLAGAITVVLIQAVKGARGATFVTPPAGRWDGFRHRVLVGALHIAQPVARLLSRMGYALSHPQPWGAARLGDLLPFSVAHWTERWRDPIERLREVESALHGEGGMVRRGGNFDRWDLEVYWSGFGSSRLLMAVEEHGGGHQLVRVRVWPAPALRGPLLVLLLGGLAGCAAVDHAYVAATGLGVAALFFAHRTLAALGAGAGAARRALQHLGLVPR